MTRFLTAALLTAAFVTDAASASTYTARPATPLASARIIARDISWTCGPEACSGQTEQSRPLVLCQGFAKKAGRLASFAVDGRAFAPAELDKCNAAARAAATNSAVGRD